jgi:DNA repair exonuclease SbcCD ATPase subunit
MSAMSAGPDARLQDEIARLRALIASEAAATERALVVPAPDAERHRELPEHRELSRHLASLRERVSRAEARLADPWELRAELGTLSFFAHTLRADADSWQVTVHQALEELERREAAVRQEQVRLAAERTELMRRRDVLQAKIDRTAAEMAQGSHGEWRRTVPVIRLTDAVTVSSITVSRPRKLFRAMRLWLVTLSEGRDEVLVRRD